MIEYLQTRLDQAFSPETDREIVRAVQQGIFLADQLLESEIWLSGVLGRDIRGHVRRAAILFRVYDACVSGDLPFQAVIDHMPRGPFHWVEIQSDGLKAHICRTDGPGKFPDETPTRQDERLTNQLSLFDRVVPICEAVDSAQELFAWLTFGVQDNGLLGHLCWAMPATDGATWLAHTNILTRAAKGALSEKVEPVTERVKLRFKEEIETAISQARNTTSGDN